MREKEWNEDTLQEVKIKYDDLKAALESKRVLIEEQNLEADQDLELLGDFLTK